MKVIEKQVILVIGSTDGIGKQTAFDLAEMGATILLHGRSREKGIKTKEELFQATKNNHLEFYLADFASLAEVRRLAEKIIARQVQKRSYTWQLRLNSMVSAVNILIRKSRPAPICKPMTARLVINSGA